MKTNIWAIERIYEVNDIINNIIITYYYKPHDTTIKDFMHLANEFNKILHVEAKVRERDGEFIMRKIVMMGEIIL